MDSRKEMVEKFFKKASLVVMIDDSPAVELGYKNGSIIIDIKNPILLMSLGLDMDLLKKRDSKKSVFRKMLKDMGFKIKLRYKFFEIDL